MERHPRPLKDNFEHLTELHSMERGHPGKLDYKLADKAPRPSTLERVNVVLAAAATHKTTSNVLGHFTVDTDIHHTHSHTFTQTG